MISFDATPDDRALIAEIAQRAARDLVEFDAITAAMDVTCCHLNGCPLDLPRLLAADAFNFAHDIAGINRHLDRSTGRLRDHFLPRFALHD